MENEINKKLNKKINVLAEGGQIYVQIEGKENKYLSSEIANFYFKGDELLKLMDDLEFEKFTFELNKLPDKLMAAFDANSKNKVNEFQSLLEKIIIKVNE